MDMQRSGIVTLDLLNGAATDHIQSSPELLLDLNLPPNTDLQLGLPAQQPTAVFRQLNYESVCTLDKVRSALERFERGCKKRRLTADGVSISTATSLSTITSSSVKDLGVSAEREDVESYESSSVIDASSMTLAGCPRCFIYLLISKGNPSCPRCGSRIPVSVMESKKRDRAQDGEQ